MTSEEEKFLHLIKELMDNFNQQLSRRKLKVWHERLSQELTIEELEEAVNRALFECKFMPTGRELVELVKGTNSAIAQEEWEEAKRVASRGIEKLSEAKTLSATAKHAIRGIGGIKKLGLMTEKQETWLKKEFSNLYESYAKVPNKMLPQGESKLYSLNTGNIIKSMR
ncbi:MAG: hypothetical protein ABEI32_13720 [Halothece sp.]|jgi:hypothetical protein